MTRVFLFSTFRESERDTHWASPYAVLRKAFTRHCSPEWQLVETPDAADLILICPRARNPVFPFEIFRQGIAFKHRHKCVVVSTDDNPTLTHKGFYTSLQAGSTRSPWLKGGFYPLVAYSEPLEAFPLETKFRYLFSFLGSFDTHPVRRCIGALPAGQSRLLPFLIKDTSARSKQAACAPGDTDAFRHQYIAAMRDSKFILCPRGMCPSSVRLFETMKAGRVPVVISDEWVRPPEIAWHRFIITIKEKDVASIPTILASEETSFNERAQIARRAWDDHFESGVLANTVTRWGMTLVAEARMGEHSAAHLVDLWRQATRWRFFRRGILSELLRLVGTRA